MSIEATLGRNIRRLRVQQGLSQEELAHRAGIDRSYLSEIENGQKNVGIAIVACLAHALEIPIATLFDGYR